MTIRPARREDVPAIQALLEENKLLLDGVEYTDFTHPCLVAIRNDEIIGMIHAHVGRPYAVITDLAVRGDVQSHGIGVRLAQAMELLLRVAGVTAYVAFCAASDTRMADMLERFGFTTTGLGRGFVRRLT